MIRSIFIILIFANSCWGQSSLNVMTFNIRYLNENDGENHWDNRKEAVAKIVKDRKIDVVGFQEVVRQQKNDLSDLLSEYDSYGVGRDDGIGSGEYCPIYFLRERLELVDKGTFWLSKRPGVPGSKNWDAAITRIASWVRLKSKVDEKFEFLFVNTHFDHRGTEARYQSSKIIVEKINNFQRDLLRFYA